MTEEQRDLGETLAKIAGAQNVLAASMDEALYGQKREKGKKIYQKAMDNEAISDQFDKSMLYFFSEKDWILIDLTGGLLAGKTYDFYDAWLDDSYPGITESEAETIQEDINYFLSHPEECELMEEAEIEKRIRGCEYFESILLADQETS